MRGSLDLSSIDILRASKLRLAFRPDFFEWWPRFTTRELSCRLKRLAPSRASLLTLANLEALQLLAPSVFEAWHSAFTGLGWAEQACEGADVMAQVGIAEPVCRAFAAIDRAAFLPDDLRPLAFINASVPVSGASNSTAFGLSAIVAGAVLRARPRRVIEVGLGSGSLAALICESAGENLRYEGYEPDASLQLLWEQACRRVPAARRVRVRWRPFVETDISLQSGDMLLFSCAPPPDLVVEIETAILASHGAVAIVPQALSVREFEGYAAGQLRWKGATIGDYATYQANTRAYMELLLLTAMDGRLLRERVCGNVQYIHWVPPGSDLGPLDNFTSLSLLLDRQHRVFTHEVRT